MKLTPANIVARVTASIIIWWAMVPAARAYRNAMNARKWSWGLSGHGGKCGLKCKASLLSLQQSLLS
jgi:hypothetical protein